MSKLREVAKLAGVSAATVSRTLARPEMVASETRDRVMQAVSDIGFRPNALARSLRQQESRHIGLLITDLNPFHAALAKGVQDTAEEYELNVLLFTSDDTEHRERWALETVGGYRPQGLIYIPTAHSLVHQDLLQQFPVVEVDRVSHQKAPYTVTVDNRTSAAQITRHLLDLGHRHIAGLFGDPNISTADERRLGFLDAFEEAGVSSEGALILHGDNREGSGYELTRELLSLQPRPTALFSSSLEMCVGAIRAIHEADVRLPDDLSLVGFDDGRVLQLHQPPVTVVAQPPYELGRAACNLLINLLRSESPTVKSQHVTLSTELIIRQSTAPPGGRTPPKRSRRST